MFPVWYHKGKNHYKPLLQINAPQSSSHEVAHDTFLLLSVWHFHEPSLLPLLTPFNLGSILSSFHSGKCDRPHMCYKLQRLNLNVHPLDLQTERPRGLQLCFLCDVFTVITSRHVMSARLQDRKGIKAAAFTHCCGNVWTMWLNVIFGLHDSSTAISNYVMSVLQWIMGK